MKHTRMISRTGLAARRISVSAQREHDIKQTIAVMMALALVAGGAAAMTGNDNVWDWMTASPESQEMVSAKLEALWDDLKARDTHAFLVIRSDRTVFERYADGYNRTKPHYTASLAKALVGGVTLMLAMNDGRIRPNDLVCKYVPP